MGLELNLAGENTENFFGWRQYEDVRSRIRSSTHKKQLGISIGVYIY